MEKKGTDQLTITIQLNINLPLVFTWFDLDFLKEIVAVQYLSKRFFFIYYLYNSLYAPFHNFDIFSIVLQCRNDQNKEKSMNDNE